MYTHMRTFIHICTSMIQWSLETGMSKHGIPPKPPTTISFCGTTRNEGANFWRHECHVMTLTGCWKIRSSSCRQLWMPNAPWFPLQLSCPRSGSCWTAPDSTRFQQCRNIGFPKFLRVPLAFTISGIECLPLLRTSSWKPLRSVKLQQFCTCWLAESCNCKTHEKKNMIAPFI